MDGPDASREHSARAFSPAHLLSSAEKVAFVTGRNDRALGVQYTIHHRTGPAWNAGPRRNVSRGEALLRADASGGWRVTAYEARLTRR